MTVAGQPTSGVAALAAGDFGQLAACFTAGGVHVAIPAHGMLLLQPPVPSGTRLLVSVGVHGNETAPIEMLAALLDSLALTPQALVPELLLVVGNPAAIAAGTRFVEADLNRLFGTARGALVDAVVAGRADAIMQASTDFFRREACRKWHLDLHTAIRPSCHARFAVIPAAADDPAQLELCGWLGSAGIDALLFNAAPASTYSAYSARTLGACSCTLELGQVGLFGGNLPDQLSATATALGLLVRGQVPVAAGARPLRFMVAQEIIKHSDAFQLHLDDATPNFTAFAPGALVATDGERVVRVGPVTQYIVFPNPRVQPGQRAGLLLVHDVYGVDGSAVK